MTKKRGGVLLLTNNAIALNLYDWLILQVDNVDICSEKICPELINTLKPELIISYNYSYIIRQDSIDAARNNIINLHISYLPYNRGASPNIWSFIDRTPKGVTIHKINAGLDKGDILFQKELYFDEMTETFSGTYKKLHEAITELFKENWNDIKNGSYELFPQVGNGTYHTNNDLNLLKSKIDFNWDDNIYIVVNEYDRMMKN